LGFFGLKIYHLANLALKPSFTECWTSGAAAGRSRGLSFFQDIRIADRQNVDIQIANSKNVDID
jgi:hypothetical protein